MQDAVEAEKARLANERVKIAEERLRLVEAQHEAEQRTKPAWWSEWTKPGPILVIAGILGGQFLAYQQDRAALTNSINEKAAQVLALSAKMDLTQKAAEERAAKYVPAIERNSAGLETQQLINRQITDRIQSIVESVQDLRRSVEVLRDMEQKTREDLIEIRAKREREGRVFPNVPRAGP